MSIPFRTISRCEYCEHGSDHACQALRESVRCAVSEYNGRMARHGLPTPEGAEVVLSCPMFWRTGRSHGD